MNLRANPRAQTDQLEVQSQQDGRGPIAELALEAHGIDEHSSEEKVPFRIFHARVDLALRLSPIGPTHSQLEVQIVPEGVAGGIPGAPLRLTGIPDSQHSVIQMLLGMAAAMGNDSFMTLEKLCQRLIGTAMIEPAPVEAQREHDYMHHTGSGAGRARELDPNQCDVAGPAVSHSGGESAPLAAGVRTVVAHTIHPPVALDGTLA